MKLNIADDHSSACKAAAREIADAIRAFEPDADHPTFNFGLATGNTMEPLYDELVRMHEEGLDFSNVHFFQLDEFKDVPPEGERSEHSFNYALKKLFLEKIKADDKHCHLMDGTKFNAAAFEEEIKQAGGMDVQLLGIGREGHIGFNEAGQDRDETTRTGEVKLAQSTIEESAAHWEGKKNVPEFAYTQGIGTILDAKRIIMIINGGHKAKILEEMLTDGEVADLPARALLKHKDLKEGNVTSLHVDKPSTELLTDDQLRNYAGKDDQGIADHKKFFAPIHIDLGDDKFMDLPYNANVFIPSIGRKEKFDPTNEEHVKKLKETFAYVTDSYEGAHQDDTELWVPHAIEQNQMAQKKGRPNQFLSIILTDGAAYTTALKRDGEYTSITPEQIIAQRQEEQIDAATTLDDGHYPVIQLMYPSNTVKGYLGDDKTKEVVNTLTQIYDALPKHKTAYQHHPVDIHETHVACVNLGVEALRNSEANRLKEKGPRGEDEQLKVYGMPAWGEAGVTDAKFAVEDPTIVGRLLQAFQSQLKMQKRTYDIGGVANLQALATFRSDPHASDPPEGIVIGLDITDAVTKGKSLIHVIEDAFGDRVQQASEWLSEFSAPKSEERGNGKWSDGPRKIEGFATKVVRKDDSHSLRRPNIAENSASKA